jgi:manganese oxidase
MPRTNLNLQPVCDIYFGIYTKGANVKKHKAFIQKTIDSHRGTSHARRTRQMANHPVISAAALFGLLGLAAVPTYAKFDIPTGANPSPLFGATPFSQKLLMFEEFGPQPLPTSAAAHSLPAPGGCNGPANPSAYTGLLDTFLSQPLFPAPQEQANTGSGNPWAANISTCLGRTVTGVLEGRPPGADFAHQRWSEFPATPEAGAVYFQTAQAGARPNGGIRDSLQLHGYALGEFGPGGLYHNTTGFPGFDGTTSGIKISFHTETDPAKSWPVQDPQHVWTFDGTLPPKLLMAPYATTILNRHYNALPISDAANGGFGKHTITTHEHNGHNPAESDGFAGAFFFPGEFYDYRWPMVLAGNDSIPIGSSDPVLAEKNSKAGTPACADPRPGKCATPGATRKVPGDWHETMSTHWFHDHMVDFTAQNVYKGNAAMMNYYSAIDRGNEAIDDGVNLRFPSGTALDWGNRDYDVNLVVADKAFDANGQLWFNTLQTDGFMGDVATVNFLYKPYLDVRARKYRFRILNGSVSRYWKIALVQQVQGSGGQFPGPAGSGVSYNQVPFHMIGNDGNIMEHAVPFPNVQSPEGLPSQGIAERDDIIVDFSKFAPGAKLYMVNILEHQDGKTPKQAVPLALVLSGAYSAGGCPASCDPVVGQFMELRVQAMQTGAVDVSMNPADYEEGKKSMIPLPGFTAQELATAKERTFSFNRGGDVKPWTISTDGGASFNATSVEGLFNRVSAAPTKGGVEIWHIRNGGQGWSHPVHIHFEEGQILQRGGVAPPLWEKGARKDMYRIGPLPDSTDSVDLAIRVREFQGTYVEHCHNTQHEDNAMLLRWDSQNPGQTVAIPTPFPSWDGVTYVASNTTDVPTFKTGKATTFLANVVAPIAANDTASTSSGVAVRIPVLDNDTCVGDCDPASLLIGTAPANGTAVRNADGTVTYTPNAGFTGTNSFTYTVRDTTTGTQVSNPATVTVTVGVTAPPPKPVAANDTATTIQGTVVGINVIANDTNCGSGCTVAIVAAPTHGTAVANSPAAGQVTYTPAAGFTGADTFTYTASNAGGTSNTAQVTVNVTANPVTDMVTITKAVLAKAGNLSVTGTVSLLNSAFAPSVTVFAGAANASHTACTGTSLGTAPVSTKPGPNAGSWSFSKKAVAPTPRVCVQSPNGGVADAPLQ